MSTFVTSEQLDAVIRRASSEGSFEVHTLRFLARLLNTNKAEAAKRKLTWQVFPESEKAKQCEERANLFYASFSQVKDVLLEYNELGFGIFITINHSGGDHRSAADILSLRGIWADLDEKDSKSGVPLDLTQIRREIRPNPHIVVRSGHGTHLYWVFPQSLSADKKSTSMVKTRMLGVCEALGEFGSDRKVCEIARVMRVPGFFNMKADPIMVTLEFVSEVDETLTTERLLTELADSFPYEGSAETRPGFHFDYESDIEDDERLELAAAWLEGKPEAVQGNNGSGVAMSAAWVGPLFALEHDVAFDLLLEKYNPRCEPPWSPEEMDHKLTDAYKSASVQGRVGAALPDFKEKEFQACLERTPVEVANDAESYPSTQEQESSDLTEDAELDLKCSQFDYNDLGLAHRLHLRYGNILKYWNRAWYYFNGTYWVQREDVPLKLLERTIRKINRKELLLLEDEENRKALLKWASTLGSQGRLSAGINLGKSLMAKKGPFEVPSPSLINFQNGTLDLRTGTLQDHKPEDSFLYCLPFDYTPDQQSPTWLRYLATVFSGDQELIDFVQALVGCTLLSNTDDEFAVWLSGDGSNGKTTFTGTISYTLGNLAQVIPNDLFMTKRYGQSHPTEIARLNQVKFATCSDISLNAKLDEGTFKRLVSTGQTTGRYMNKDFFDFTMSHKFWISVNNLPSVYDESFGLWRRMIVIPFNRQFTGEDRDERIKDRLKAEAVGIWSWMVKGAMRFAKEGMPPRPQAVVDAAEAWRSNEDWWENFISEECRKDQNFSVPLSRLIDRYREWCKRNQRSPMSPKSFSNKVRQSGFSTYKNSVTYVRGLRLNHSWDEENSPDLGFQCS